MLQGLVSDNVAVKLWRMPCSMFTYEIHFLHYSSKLSLVLYFYLSSLKCTICENWYTSISEEEKKMGMGTWMKCAVYTHSLTCYFHYISLHDWINFSRTLQTWLSCRPSLLIAAYMYLFIFYVFCDFTVGRSYGTCSTLMWLSL